MKLKFIKVNPVENMTIFILDPVPRKDHIKIANKIMDYSNLHAEQVGFIETLEKDDSSIRLQMMGGEFCGNASRSLAALMVHKDYPETKKIDDKFIIPLNVSGIDTSINCEVTPSSKNNIYDSKIQMPLPLSIKKIDLKLENNTVNLIRVDLPGITHFIVDNDKVNNRDKFYNTVKKDMDNEKYDAFGIIYYDEAKNYIDPLVYVRATDTLFWERSCASGTCALGAALSFSKKENIDKDILQPGGSLNVSVRYESEKIKELSLSGDVEIVAEGTVYI